MSAEKRNFVYRTNIYWALVLHLILVLLLYALCRIGFYLFNTSYFPSVSVGDFLWLMAGGLQFDVAAILYSNIAFILMMVIPLPVRYHPVYKKVAAYLFVIVNSVALACNVIDFIYYRFTLQRTTLSIFSQFRHETNLPGLFVHFLFTYWYAVLLFAALVFLLKKGYDRIDYRRATLPPMYQYITGFVLLPLFILLFVGGVRGGFAHSTRPITISNAAQWCRNPQEACIVLNTPFAMIRTATTERIEKVHYFTDSTELNRLFTPLHTPHDTAAFRPGNVVVIIMESFSKEFISAYNKNAGSHYHGYAPFLDSLIGKSYAFQYSFANGKKSIEAMPSVLCSLPSAQVPFVLSDYSGDKLNSLPSLLKDKGYYTAFFHGAPNGSMGFLAFSKQVGFDDYYGKDEYNNDADFDGIWGIWDESFLQFFANKMNTFRQPFFTSVFTLSSHDPFAVPGKYKAVFTGGPLTEDKCIQYTDYSLRRFFETAQRMPWFQNTLFVLTADHTSSQSYYPQYNSTPGRFSIPVFFYKPGADTSFFKPEAIEQADIMPTILGYLHYNKPYIAFGRDVLAEDAPPYAFNYSDGVYNLFYGDYLLLFQNGKAIGLYNYKTDFTQQHNLLLRQPGVAQDLTLRIEAFIQQYNNRIADNDLTTEGSQLKLHAAMK